MSLDKKDGPSDERVKNLSAAAKAIAGLFSGNEVQMSCQAAVPRISNPKEQAKFSEKLDKIKKSYSKTVNVQYDFVNSCVLFTPKKSNSSCRKATDMAMMEFAAKDPKEFLEHKKMVKDIERRIQKM